MNNIIRKTKVISVSLPRITANKLEKFRKLEGKTRSSFISALIEYSTEDIRWQRIYKKGTETAKKFNITSEDDIDKIIHS